jgi:hypothetical protein
MIDNAAVMDRFIKFENLLSDLKEVSGALGIEFTPESLGTYKRGYRSRQEHFSDYYDAETRHIVERAFDWEINRFGYAFDSGGARSLAVSGLA